MDAQPVRDLPIKTIEEEVVVTSDQSATIDGNEYVINAGTWAIYVPKLELKILRAEMGKCIYSRMRVPTPESIRIQPAEQINGNCTNGEWVAALDTSVFHRVAENCVAAQRLARCGLGPALRAAVAVRSFSHGSKDNEGPSAGMIVDNLQAYPTRSRVSEKEMIAAGVNPDRIRASLRQQIRGYISDLNSVIPVFPLKAEKEVDELKKRLESTI